MTTHGDGGKMVRYSRVSRLCDHQTSDDGISEKLLSNGPSSLRPRVLSCGESIHFEKFSQSGMEHFGVFRYSMFHAKADLQANIS